MTSAPLPSGGKPSGLADGWFLGVLVHQGAAGRLSGFVLGTSPW